jgi:hypothetical protein
MALTMKNAVVWDIKPQFAPHKTMKNAVFWDVTPCGYRKSRRFRGMYRLYHQDEEVQRARNVSNI